jgi:hypothetical protein
MLMRMRRDVKTLCSVDTEGSFFIEQVFPVLVLQTE